MVGYAKLGDLTQRCIRELSQVPGSGTQLYSEDVIVEHLKGAFGLCIRPGWWPRVMKWFGPITLDGAMGLPTSDLVNVPTYEDIRAIFIDTSQRPLPGMPFDVNPNTITGAVPKFQEALAKSDEPSTTSNRLFRVWPLTSTGTVWVHARQIPANTFDDPESVLYFDDDTLVYGACWMYASDDAANPAAIAKFEKLFNLKQREQLDAYNKQPILLDPRPPAGFDQWVEYPPM